MCFLSFLFAKQQHVASSLFGLLQDDIKKMSETDQENNRVSKRASWRKKSFDALQTINPLQSERSIKVSHT